VGRPLLAFAIPTYNRAAELAELLATLEHELTGDELILVSDNASPDRTREVLDEAAGRGLPLLVHRQDENVGGVRNVHWLLENAPEADYVWCLGDDDRPGPGAVAEVVQLLREEHPAWLHLPHSWADETGRTVNASPVPAALERHSGSGDLYRAHGHWLTFLSASVVARDALRDAARSHPTDNAYAPLVWFFRAALDGVCLVPPARLVSGSAEISWSDRRAEYVTRHYVGLFDEAISLALSADEFATSLDHLYASDDFLRFWREQPVEELVVAVERFPASRLLRRFLWELGRGDPALVGRLDTAARSAGAAEASAELVADGEQRFGTGDTEGALGAFRQALLELPTSTAAWNDLGVALHALGRPGARDAFEQALALDPEDEDARANLAGID
jgi:glycosyltransferase involved in cell wall biosynthesis